MRRTRKSRSKWSNPREAELLCLELANHFSFIGVELSTSPLTCLSPLLNYQSPPLQLDFFPIISEPPPHLTRQKDGGKYVERFTVCLSGESVSRLGLRWAPLFSLELSTSYNWRPSGARIPAALLLHLYVLALCCPHVFDVSVHGWKSYICCQSLTLPCYVML